MIDWSCLEKWLKELTLFVLFFSTMTQRIELFVNDSLNWASFMNLFSIRVEFFLFLPQRIEPCFSKMTHRIEPLFWIWRTELNPYFEYDAKNWILFLRIWRKELYPFSSNMTQRIESFFLEIWRKELNSLFKMTRRIELSRKNCSKTWNFFFWTWLKRTLFWMWLKNWKFLVVKKLNSFQKITTQRIELFFFQKKDAKSVFLKKSDSKNGTFLKIWLIELIFSNKTWLKELNLFTLTQRTDFF